MLVQVARWEVREVPAVRCESLGPKPVAQAVTERIEQPFQEELYLVPIVLREFAVVRIAAGGTTSCDVDPKIVFGRLLREFPNCTQFVLAHTHPSGQPNPSGEDLLVMRRIKSAADLLGYTLEDFLVVGCGGAYWSARQDGSLP